MVDVFDQPLYFRAEGAWTQLRKDYRALEKHTAQLEAKVKSLEERCARLRYALEAYDPPMPPMLEGETAIEYTNRLTGADGTNRRPYAERRLRQCSIGYHDECSDPEGIDCKCPCHQFDKLRSEALELEATAMSAEAQTDD